MPSPLAAVAAYFAGDKTIPHLLLAISEPENETVYVVRVLCGAQEEAHVRALLLHGFSEAGLSLRELDSVDMERPGPATVEVSAHVAAVKRYDAALERIAGRISLEPSISAIRWSIEADGGGA